MTAPAVLITGGAGFIGASIALELAARHPDWEVLALDNLHRRGSELNLVRLKAAGKLDQAVGGPECLKG